jgi:hypothetical protein
MARGRHPTPSVPRQGTALPGQPGAELVQLSAYRRRRLDLGLGQLRLWVEARCRGSAQDSAARGGTLPVSESTSRKLRVPRWRCCAECADAAAGRRLVVAGPYT